MNENHSITKKWFHRLKIVSGIGILSYVLYQTEWDQFGERIESVHWVLLFLLFLVGFLDRCLMGYKWNLLLRSQQIFTRHTKAISIYFVASFLGNWTPGAIGADAIRVSSFMSHKKSAVVVSSILLERAIGLLVLLSFVFIALPFSTSILGVNAPLIKTLSVTVFFVGLVTILFSFSAVSLRLIDKIYFPFSNITLLKKLYSFFHAYQSFGKVQNTLYCFTALTFIEASLTYFHSYVAAKSLGMDIPLLFFFATMPVLHFLLRLPLTINGLGVQEGLFAYVLTLAGYSAADGVAMSLLLRINGVVAIYIPAGLMLLFSKPSDNQ